MQGDDSLVLPLTVPIENIRKFHDALLDLLNGLNGGVMPRPTVAAGAAAQARAPAPVAGASSDTARRSGAASGGRQAAAAAAMASVRDSLGEIAQGKNVGP